MPAYLPYKIKLLCIILYNNTNTHTLKCVQKILPAYRYYTPPFLPLTLLWALITFIIQKAKTKKVELTLASAQRGIWIVFFCFCCLSECVCV
jgi:hypothetical protein